MLAIADHLDPALLALSFELGRKCKEASQPHHLTRALVLHPVCALTYAHYTQFVREHISTLPRPLPVSLPRKARVTGAAVAQLTVLCYIGGGSQPVAKSKLIFSDSGSLSSVGQFKKKFMKPEFHDFWVMSRFE